MITEGRGLRGQRKGRRVHYTVVNLGNLCFILSWERNKELLEKLDKIVCFSVRLNSPSHYFVIPTLWHVWKPYIGG